MNEAHAGRAHLSPLERVKQLGLITAITVASFNVWTGAPLAGIWLGSRVVVAQGEFTLLAAGVVVVAMLALCLALVWLVARLTAKYEDVTGTASTVRRHAPWLRSMRGERSHSMPGMEAKLTAVEYVVVGSVILCVAAFEVWFFFFSGSPIDQRSGR